MSQHQAQDPNELFDVIDAYGRPTGVTRRRADIHRDGDWHRAIHVWIYGIAAAGPFLMLQRRGHDKDTWPGKLDASAAGHLAAGEVPEGAFREIEEELGITPDLAALRHVGARINVSERPEWLDRELQEVYLLRDDRPLNTFVPNATEVDALVRAPLNAWLRLVFNEQGSIDTTMLMAASGAVETVTIDHTDPVPSIDGYFRRVAVACQRALAGEHYLVV